MHIFALAFDVLLHESCDKNNIGLSRNLTKQAVDKWQEELQNSQQELLAARQRLSGVAAELQETQTQLNGSGRIFPPLPLPPKENGKTSNSVFVCSRGEG